MQKSEDSTSLETSKETTHVNFVCQRCFQPLKLDPSLYSLDEETHKELQSGLTPPDTPADIPQDTNCNSTQILNSDIIAKVISPARTSGLNGSGFTLIGMGVKDPSAGVSPSNLLLSHRFDVTAKLFDVMSGDADVDHPLCEECTDNLLDQLDNQLHITEKELESYKELLSTLESKSVLDDTELDAELQQLQLEEKKLVDELSKVEKEYDGILRERDEMKAMNKRIDKEEEAYWREYCDNQKSILDFEDEKASVHNYLHYAQTQLDKLRKTNVFNSTFHIWHKGHFGTINNFRLGRLPSVPVEWTEINAAWGQTVLLLQSLAKKIGLTFKRYRLVPYGNHSFIECLDDKSKELPLYGSGGFRFFWDTKFDHSMVAFLDCLQQFKEEVEKGDSKFYLPYRMDKGKIYDSSGSGAYSVKIQFNSEEHWTKALKFMLTNLKWGLAWVSSQFADKHS